MSRRRAGSLFAGAALAVTAVALLAGFGAGTALSVSCDLGALRPIGDVVAPGRTSAAVLTNITRRGYFPSQPA